MGRAVELQEQVLAVQFRAQFQLTAVAADHLVGLVVRVILRDLLHGMGQANGGALPFPTSEAVKPGRGEFPVIAKTQHSEASLCHFSPL